MSETVQEEPKISLCPDGQGRTFASLTDMSGASRIVGDWSLTIEGALVSLAEKLRQWVSELDGRPWGSLDEEDRLLYAWARRFVG